MKAVRFSTKANRDTQWHAMPSAIHWAVDGCSRRAVVLSMSICIQMHSNAGPASCSAAHGIHVGTALSLRDVTARVLERMHASKVKTKLTRAQMHPASSSSVQQRRKYYFHSMQQTPRQPPAAPAAAMQALLTQSCTNTTTTRMYVACLTALVVPGMCPACSSWSIAS
jgi:hypothetical protein